MAGASYGQRDNIPHSNGRERLVNLIGTLRAWIRADTAVTRGGPRSRRLALESGRDELIRQLPADLRSADEAAVFREVAGIVLPRALLEALPDSGELLIIPHSILGLLPFSALPADSAGEPLGIRYALRFSPSLITLVSIRGGAALLHDDWQATPLLVGNPAMPMDPNSPGGVQLEQLAQTAAEINEIAQRLKSPALTGSGATESVVRSRLSGASLVHLATHGFAYSSDEKVRDSYVALAPDSINDGLFTVGEILDELNSPMVAELVVLSACQTGLGNLLEAEGTVGFQRAFLARGARSVLVSQWSVDESATRELMVRFYSHWLGGQGRISKAEALRRAQIEVRKSPGARSPYHWAAFQLVGAP